MQRIATIAYNAIARTVMYTGNDEFGTYKFFAVIRADGTPIYQSNSALDAVRFVRGIA
jgi:hypothetical protein